jgi:hypothetical protein
VILTISRQDSNEVKRFFSGCNTDELLQDASGYTLWVMK